MHALSRSALRIACLAAALSVMPHPGEAQGYPAWGNVDTATSGAFNEFNAALISSRGLYGSYDFIDMIFERRTDTESQIVSRRYNSIAGAWDSGEVVISGSPLASPQVKPAYALLSYSPGPRLVQIAVWQRWNDLRWQLYYSTLVDTATSWSQPALVAADSVDNTDVRVQRLADSTFLVAWRQGDAIAGLRMTPVASSPPETLGVSSTHDFSFDMGSRDGFSATLVWTSTVHDTPMAVWRTVSTIPSWAVGPETLRTQWPCFNPHICVGPYSDPEFLYESPVSGSLQVVYNLGQYTSGQVTSDPGADHRNGHAYSSPVITRPVAGSAVAYFPMNVVVYEKSSPGDSSLVFAQNFGAADTVRSPGHNRNVCLGSQWIQTKTGFNLLAVWESNRTGRSHIYSRLVPFFFDGVSPNPAPQPGFQLEQNYPNPFNPATTIRYSIPERSTVLLTLFNTLGQAVKTLVNESQEPGPHSVRFEANKLASGLYFYRLIAGTHAATMRLMLIR